MGDEERFIQWLQGQGLPDAHLAAYRKYLAELGKHPSLSAAIKAGEAAGTPPREIANMRQVAARFATFKDTGAATAPSIEKPAKLAVASEPALEIEARTPALAVEARTPLATPTKRLGDTDPPRRGCSCKKRYDVYLDNDFGALGKLLGGGVGIGTFILIRMIGVLGALCLALGLAGMGGLITCFSICLRCEGCRQRVSDLDSDERAHVRKGRGLTALVTAGLLLGSAVCGYLWISLFKTSRGG